MMRGDSDPTDVLDNSVRGRFAAGKGDGKWRGNYRKRTSWSCIPRDNEKSAATAAIGL